MAESILTLYLLVEFSDDFFELECEIETERKTNLSDEVETPHKRNRFASETIHVSEIGTDERYEESGHDKAMQ